MERANAKKLKKLIEDMLPAEVAETDSPVD